LADKTILLNKPIFVKTQFSSILRYKFMGQNKVIKLLWLYQLILY